MQRPLCQRSENVRKFRDGWLCGVPVRAHPAQAQQRPFPQSEYSAKYVTSGPAPAAVVASPSRAAGIKTGLRSEEHLSKQQAFWQQRETGVAETTVKDSLVDPPSAWAARVEHHPKPIDDGQLGAAVSSRIFPFL